MRKWIIAVLIAAISPASYGATQAITVDTKTHLVQKPPPSTGSAFDLDFSGLNLNGISGGGGGGSPGGTVGQFQYKFSNSAFGGVPYLSYDGTLMTLVAGSRLNVVDSTDLTKKLTIDLSNLTTGVLRRLTIPNADSVTVIPDAGATNNFLTGITSAGAITKAQPAFSNLSGNYTLAQGPSTTASKLLGRGDSGAGIPQEITLGANLTMTGTTLAATGGSGTPGGSDTQLQRNNAGAFGGISSLTSDGTVVNQKAGINYFLLDSADPTKKLRFDLASITTATTRVTTVPNANNVLVVPDTGATNNFLTGITTNGAITKAQPAFTNISGVIATAQNNVPVGASLFVDGTNGNDSTGQRGRLDKPFLTISAAVAAASAGDTVYVGPGTFTENSGVTIPGISLIGSGQGQTIIMSNLNSSTHAVLVPGSGSYVADLTVQTTGAIGVPIGVLSSDSPSTNSTFSGVQTIALANGFVVDHTGTTSFRVYNSITVVGNAGAAMTAVSSVTGTNSLEFWDHDFIVTGDGTSLAAPVAVSVANGTVRFFRSRITTSNAGLSGDNQAIKVTGGTVEAHDISITSDYSGGGTVGDLSQSGVSFLKIENVSRVDGAALVTSGTITQLSRYAVRDNNLSDFPNIGSGTRGDIIFRGASGWTKLAAGTDGNVLTTHSTTADPTWSAGGGSGTFAIGAAVTGGHANDLLFIDGSVNLAQNDGFTFNGTTFTVPGGTVTTSNLALNGSTSGTATVKAPAVAGTTTLTLPLATTNLSTTGGSNHVLKQGSAGGAITSGTVDLANMSNLAASTLIGRDSSGTGVPEAITLGTNLTMTSGGVLNAAGASLANPTASVGLSAVNGSASTAMRSDAAPPLDQAIAPSWTGVHTFNEARTIASGTSAINDDVNIAANTTTVTGTTAITTGRGFNKFSIYKPTYTDSSAVTVTNAATLYIEDAPNAASSLTITNPYALWVDSGATRLDGSLTINGGGTVDASVGYKVNGAATNNYTLTGDGTKGVFYPKVLTNSATTSQSTAFASDTYVTGSNVVLTAGDLKAKGQYHCVFDMTKTAGTATPIVTFRTGTAGTTSDTARLTFTFGAGTAVTDIATFEVWVNFRSVGSGTSAVVSGICKGSHNLATTGMFNNANVWVILAGPSLGFDSTTPTNIGLSFNGGTSFSGTVTLVKAELIQ